MTAPEFGGHCPDRPSRRRWTRGSGCRRMGESWFCLVAIPARLALPPIALCPGAFSGQDRCSTTPARPKGRRPRRHQREVEGRPQSRLQSAGGHHGAAAAFRGQRTPCRSDAARGAHPGHLARPTPNPGRLGSRPRMRERCGPEPRGRRAALPLGGRVGLAETQASWAACARAVPVCRRRLRKPSGGTSVPPRAIPQREPTSRPQRPRRGVPPGWQERCRGKRQARRTALQVCPARAAPHLWWWWVGPPQPRVQNAREMPT